MPTHSTAVRNDMANLVVDKLDLGSGNAEGTLVFLTAGDAEVASLPLSNPAYGNSAAGVTTANAITSDTNATGGTITKYNLVDRDDVIIVTGDVSTSGADINLSSVVIGAGDTVSMTSLTYTAPA